MLQLISLPCMQHLTELDLPESPQWIDRPRVQAALLGLPRLGFLGMTVGRNTKFLPSAVATASKLSWIVIQLRRRVLPAGSLRALRLCPNLTPDFGLPPTAFATAC